MHNGLHPLLALVATAFLASWGLAQLGPEVITTYHLDRLEKQPGKLLVSPGYLTVVDFPEAIQSVSSGRSSLVRSEVQGARLLLTATASQGRTDLVVSSGSRTALFVVALTTDASGPRRYRVSDEPSPVAQKAAPTTPRPVLTPPYRPSPLPLGRLLRAQASENDLRLEVELASWPEAGGGLSLRYTLENRGAKPVLVDPTLLELTTDGRRVPYRLAREPNPDSRFLTPGTTERGLILVERPVRASLRLRWPLVQTRPATRTTLEVTFDASTTPAP